MTKSLLTIGNLNKRKVLVQVMEDIEEIKEDPEGWALQEQEEDDSPKDPSRDFLSERKKK